MLILADENIPHCREAFSEFGEIATFVGRSLQRSDIGEAEVLLVRSVTRVDERLLRGSRVGFVGSATIGFDHVDLDYLRSAGIRFARAPGSNAVSAAEYVLASILLVAHARERDIADLVVGVVGCGNVGSRVIARLEALGARCLPHDPPLAEQTGDQRYVSREEIMQADVITLHVPLERGGRHPTFQLADAAFFAAMREDAVFINTSRGEVMDQAALAARLAGLPGSDAVLDVWQGEPRVDPGVLRLAAIGSPHIAGYSLDGKVRGTEMIYRAYCEHAGVVPRWSAAQVLPPPGVERAVFGDGYSDADILRAAVLACYDPRDDDLLLRRAVRSDDPGAAFDRLRKAYRARREFANLHLQLPPGREALARRLRALEFQVS